MRNCNNSSLSYFINLSRHETDVFPKKSSIFIDECGHMIKSQDSNHHWKITFAKYR